MSGQTILQITSLEAKLKVTYPEVVPPVPTEPTWLVAIALMDDGDLPF